MRLMQIDRIYNHIYIKRVILLYPSIFLVCMVPTQILAAFFYCFNLDRLFSFSSNPITGRIGSV